MSDFKELYTDEPAINGDTDGNVESSMGAADDNFDGDADCTEERVECYTAGIEQALESAEVPKKSINLSKPAVAVVSAVAAIIVCVVALAIAYLVSYNPYNSNKDGYLPTLEEPAEANETSVDKIKEAYGLPSDMRGDTITAIALNYMPAGLYVEMNYRIPFDAAVEAMGLKDDERINPDMRYGDFEKILDEVEIEQITEGAIEDDAEGEAPAEEEAAPSDGEETTETE